MGTREGSVVLRELLARVGEHPLSAHLRHLHAISTSSQSASRLFSFFIKNRD